jgi:zinc protease
MTTPNNKRKLLKIVRYRIKQLANDYLNPNKMIYLVVGDAETQLKKLEQLGFALLLNKEK